MDQLRHRQPCAVGDRGDRGVLGRRHRHLVRARARDRNGATTTLSARAVISAVGQLNRPHLPDIDGQRDFRRAGVPLRASGTTPSTSRGKRVAMIGAGASGFQIAPAIADDVDRLTVFQRTAQWMFPNPNYHERGGPRRAVGAAAPAVLRPLVPVPALLARLRQGPRGRPGRPGLPGPAEGGQRDQRDHPADVHRLDHQPGRRRSGTARQGGARLPGDRQAHAAGQRQLAAHADPRQRRAGPRRASTTSRPTRSSPTTATRTRPTSSCTPPASRPTSCCGR